ncbi:MAG TPA: DNA repair protein RadC [Candidatus Limnocylindria bacterium]
MPGTAAERFLALGPGVPDDADVVSLATGLQASRCRTLLEEAGGIGGLAQLDAHELAPLPGIGRRRALALAASCELGRRTVAAAATEAGWRVRSPHDVGERLAPAMSGLEREELRVLLLNTKNAVTGARTVYAGNLAGSSVRVGEVFRDAVRRQAAAIVVVHNHPSGDPSPSAEDLRITAELAEAGRLLDIELLDHVVVGGGRWISLRALGATGAAVPPSLSRVAGAGR